MNIVTQNTANEQVSGTISCFIKKYGIRDLLEKCNARKEKGVAVLSIFLYLLQNVFADRSMYMQQKTGRYQESFSKNAYYRFLNSVKTNWQRFTTLLSARIINESLRPLTDEKRRDAFIIDDTLYSRTGYKKTELCSRVFDHAHMRYRKGFRLLTLGWSDGSSFMPINSCLLASPNEQNILGTTTAYDKRSLAGRRRQQARRKGTEVMIELLSAALKAGHRAKFVLFDSWFSAPRQIVEIKDMGLDTIAMVKLSSKVHYNYNGEWLSIKQIYSRNRKRPGRSKYLLSVNVLVGKDKPGEHSIPAKIVCVRNRNNHKDWLAILCTDTSLSEEEIIRIYGKRWDIEVFFKTCKSYLKLLTECHNLSYDALTAHVAVVFTRYMLLSLERRKDQDDRTIGELFLHRVDELADISFNHSLQLILVAMLDSICSVFHATEEQLSLFTAEFISRLPDYLKKSFLPLLHAV